MRIKAYLTLHKLTDQAFADIVGGVTWRAVRKWRSGERRPEIERMLRIEEVTNGLVRPADWAVPASMAAAE